MIDELAKVVAIHPESNCVDVVVLRTGMPMAAVRVLSGMATGQTGRADLHAPDCTQGFESLNTGERDIVAAISFYGEYPFVVGFLYPEAAQCLFKREDFKVDRHASDVYHTIDSAGNIELAHPGGAFVRIAETPAHEDLTGKDRDALWKIKRNTSRRVHIHVEQAGGKASVNIDPDGNIDIIHAGNLTTNTGGALTVAVAGSTTITSGGSITMNAPSITMNAPQVTINGALAQGKGANGGGCSMQGPVAVTNDVVAGGKSLMGHVHSGVTPGGGNTGAPV